MTTEKAIQELRGYKQYCRTMGFRFNDWREALDMAIEALDKPLPKPHERLMHWDTARRIIDSPRSKSQMLAVLDSVPPVEALERQQGEWIEDGYQGYPCVCSVCGIAQDIKAKFLFSFCPNCGARMVSI